MQTKFKLKIIDLLSVHVPQVVQRVQSRTCVGPKTQFAKKESPHCPEKRKNSFLAQEGEG